MGGEKIKQEHTTHLKKSRAASSTLSRVDLRGTILPLFSVQHGGWLHCGVSLQKNSHIPHLLNTHTTTPTPGKERENLSCPIGIGDRPFYLPRKLLRQAQKHTVAGPAQRLRCR